MPETLEILSPDDKPALLALNQPAERQGARAVLESLGFKVHEAADHADFLFRFAQYPYQMVLLDEKFSANAPGENQSLQEVQSMPMNRRRHATVVLLGDAFQTLHAMEAFRQSVHAVVHRSDLSNLSQILQKVAADNQLFLHVYREVQSQMAQGKL